MKRIITSLALLTMVLVPAASFARDRDDDDGYRDSYRYQQNYQPQPSYQDYSYQQYQQPYRYDRRDSYDQYQQNTYVAPQRYTYAYQASPDGYDRYYSDRDGSSERTAKYVGGGAVAGAVIGAIVGHGAGAAVGAVLGGIGGYAVQHHNDRRYDYGY